MEGTCYFKCSITNQTLTVAGPVRIKSIIAASKERRDGLHTELELKMFDDDTCTILCHKSCISSYTSSHHIARLKKRAGFSCPAQCSYEPPCKRRSEAEPFEFRKHCLFCGKECLPVDPKHPDRRPIVLQCRTLPPSGKTFKETILEICGKRGDKQAEEVRVRVNGATSDLHAADAQYHKVCYSKFVSERNVKAAKTFHMRNTQSNLEDPAFKSITEAIEDTPQRIWTSIELHDLYTEKAEVCQQQESISHRQLVLKLANHYGADLMVMRIDGCARILCFKHFVPIKLKLAETKEEDDL